MSWDKEPLLAKAKLFFERAFAESREDPLFGLWCSLGLELLARAAVASVSPTLLAEPDPDHKNLLQALKVGSDTSSRKSLAVARVLNLCRTLFPTKFSEDDKTIALALANRRNDELHTGASAFTEYPSTKWLAGLYRACRSLAESMGETLETLFGKDEAKIADEVLSQSQAEVKSRVLQLIADHTKMFAAKSPDEQTKAAESAKAEGEQLAHRRHHRVTCPACSSFATVQGEAFGQEQVSHGHDEGLIHVRQPVSPRSFSCPACGLQLQGYAELDVAGVGGQYTRTTEYSPEDYYGLIDPESFDPEPYLERYLESLRGEGDYDNE